MNNCINYIYLVRNHQAVFTKLTAPTKSAPKSTAKSASRFRRTISAVQGEPGKTYQAYKPYRKSKSTKLTASS
ncbi:hypothetical protein BpHYR1_013861 [Brachionus plicatilis]|uniref:Uncharacterized protein n=1 Tax=Brachionus plicatilis TaxID=10195 RepID=A0A3M7SAX5_BRAPC|nr:hypothetical protein BpHYR1_013861 [Brachionus plicatilis]